MKNEVFILDSNIWISYVISRRLQNLVSHVQMHSLTVLTSEHLVTELSDVLARPKFNKYIKQADIKEVIAIHLKLCLFIETEESMVSLSDPKDNFLISLCKYCDDTVLVSGDKELLKDAARHGYHVMTFQEFESVKLNK